MDFLILIAVFIVVFFVRWAVGAGEYNSQLSRIAKALEESNRLKKLELESANIKTEPKH